MLAVKPTRMELLLLRKKLKLAQKGHKLLKEKRDVLVMEFFSVLREIKGLREGMGGRLAKAQNSVYNAQAVEGELNIERMALGLADGVRMDVDSRSIMGINVPVIKNVEVKEQWHGYFGQTIEMDNAIKQYRELFPDFVKLMEAENTFGVLAVGADFATETGRDANHFDGEIFLIYHFVLEVGGDGDFGGADQALTVLSFVVIFLPPGKIAGAPHDVFIDQPGNGQGRKTLENHVFEGVSKDGVFEKNEVVFGKEGTVAGNPDRPFGVQKIESLHDDVVSFWLEIKFRKIAPLFHFLIARFVLAKRHIRRGRIGNLIHQIEKGFFDLDQLGLLILELFF